ncbi:RloB-like protein [Actinosynnema pretiosum]|nr:RloB-like protein [Actinosynnema pretiosum]
MVFTEGKITEPEYVKGLKQLPHISGNITLNLVIHVEHVVPMRLVELAVNYVDDPEIDECWCIFDVESPQPHPNLKEALALAEKRGVKVAVSNPCFETWLVLHFEDCTRAYTTAQIDRLSKRLDGRAGKSIERGQVPAPPRGRRRTRPEAGRAPRPRRQDLPEEQPLLRDACLPRSAGPHHLTGAAPGETPDAAPPTHTAVARISTNRSG